MAMGSLGLANNDVELSFKCRRCRQYLFGGDSTMTKTNGSDFLNASCRQQNSVWYLDQETAPQWVQDLIDKAQWTKGKLNCPKCDGRLGSFDFITPNKNQLSSALFSPIQVIQARVDCESTRNAIDTLRQSHQLTRHKNNATVFESNTNHSSESKDPKKVSDNQCTGVISSFAEATASMTSDDPIVIDVEILVAGNENNESKPHTGHGLCIGTHEHSRATRDFERLEEIGANPSRHFGGEEAGTEVRKRLRSGSAQHDFENRTDVEEMNEDLGANQHSEHTPRQSIHYESMTNENSQNGSDQSDQRLTQTLNNPDLTNDNSSPNEISPSGQRSPQRRSVDFDDSLRDDATEFLGVSFDGEDSASWEGFLEEIMDEMREMRTTLPAADNIDDEELSEDLHLGNAEGSSPLLSRHQSARERAALRRERNRRKKERRKRRRKERWAESQDFLPDEQDPDLSSLLDVLGTDWSRQALQEVTTCSICLDVFYQPHSCVPCNHIFCEPCLRQLASVHPVVAPCPLCRTSIRTVMEHYELTAAIQKLFPAQVKRRRKAERRTLHRSFPLPGQSSLSSITRPWFTIPRFRASDTNERVQQFTSRVNRSRQRRQQLQRTFFQELSSEMVALLMFSAVFVVVVITFLTLMYEFV